MLFKSLFYPNIKRNIDFIINEINNNNNINNEELQLIEIKIIPNDENINTNISPSNMKQIKKSPYDNNEKDFLFEICDIV